MDAGTARPTLRRDAQRNRDLLLEAAREAFREQGLGVSVNAIAHAAGVNVATLYRNFPTKEDLVLATLGRGLVGLEAARDRALEEPAVPALSRFMRDAARIQAADRGLADALGREAETAGLREQLRTRALAIIEPLVVRGHADGELRDDLDAYDVLVALQMVSRVLAAAALEERRAEHAVEIVVRGLRPG